MMRRLECGKLPSGEEVGFAHSSACFQALRTQHTMRRKRDDMKRPFKIILGVLIVAVAASASLVVWQQKNIALLRMASQYSQEDLQAEIVGRQERVQATINEHAELVVRDMTDDEKVALREGTMTQEELIGLMTGTVESTTTGEEPQSEATIQETVGSVGSITTAAPPKPVDPAYEQKLSELVAKAYILRETFQNQLTEIENSAKATYRAMPEEKRTRAALTDLIFSYYDRLVAMESECDAAMNGIVTEMRTLIADNNGDMSIADTMLEVYEEEKELKKAWYLSQLESRGL